MLSCGVQERAANYAYMEEAALVNAVENFAMAPALTSVTVHYLTALHKSMTWLKWLGLNFAALVPRLHLCSWRIRTSSACPRLPMMPLSAKSAQHSPFCVCLLLYHDPGRNAGYLYSLRPLHFAFLLLSPLFFLKVIAATIGIPLDSRFKLKDESGFNVAISSSSIADGGTYEVIVAGCNLPAIDDQKPGVAGTGSDKHAGAGTGSAPVDRRIGAPPFDSTGCIKGAIPRVAFACSGTGPEGRAAATATLKSVREHFGSDSSVSVHLLSDSIKGVQPEFNPIIVSRRGEGRDTSLFKFGDAFDALSKVIAP